jgi:hypothetical protein
MTPAADAWALFEFWLETATGHLGAKVRVVRPLFRLQSTAPAGPILQSIALVPS